MINSLKFQNTYIESLVKLSEFKLGNKAKNEKITSYGFLMQVYDLYRRVLGLKEYQFSEEVLNASRDYYAMVKNTKTKVGDHKLKSLLVNTKALVNHLSTTKDADSELVKIYIKEANIYIDDLEMYFANNEKGRLNTRLVERMKISNVAVIV